ncbi:MAG: response regulator [Kiloniellales bacterium]
MTSRILIAEDEPFIVESLRFLLSHEGYEVDAVGDGEEALAAVLRQLPDLLILDAMIPSTSGFEVLAKLRAAPRSRSLPVLVLTAKGQAVDRQRMMDLGADDFMTKPYSNKDLIERVQQLLKQARPVRL